MNTAFLFRFFRTTKIKLRRLSTQSGKEGSPYPVLLPKTKFTQRANATTKELEIQNWWESNQIYEKVLALNANNEKFTIHDGPPFANGKIHVGHALNKIIKDIINRYKLLHGYSCVLIPGWDCHGMPIEHKVVQDLGLHNRSDPVKIRQVASEYAASAVENQMKSFQRLGVWARWNQSYSTYQPDYEAEQVLLFGELWKRGLIGRGLKPVFWSPSSLTALAEAEIDYVEDHVSRSVYFAVETIEIPSIGLENISLLLWTTTPWTIPANLAISINPNITYSIISHPNVLNGSRLIVSAEALENLNSISGESFQIERSIKGEYLLGTRYRHPLTSKVYKVLSGGDAVNSTSGTGLVHIAPGHGIEDYQLGLKYDLPIFSPVDETGKFTAEAGNNLEGLDVLGKGTDAVIKLLQERNSLWKEVNYKHKYPYDWRTKLPVIFRATQQWFVHLDRFRGKVLSEIEKVNWRSNASKQRMRTLIASRNEWCLSRQRCWGVPIPAFYHKVTGEPLVNNEIINTVADIFRKEGSSAWWKKDIREFFPPSAKLSPDNFRKGYDTMDVWFDSGISWRAVVERSSSLSFPADLYLEGTDQFRGWFQSSILTAIASENSPPYKSVLSHGFVLDENGCKMSKSLGNVIDPIELIQGTKTIPSIGADTFRLWVASVDYTADSLIGKTIINQVTESYKKIRNTMRFILGNLHDFDPLQHNVQYNNLPDVDKYILGSSSKLVELADLNYDQFQFFKLYPALMHFINTDLSSFYFDISKDRLYLAAPNSLRRRAFQTTANYLLRHLLCIIAPILPHLAEEVWMHLPYTKTAESVFLSGWIPPGQIFFPFEEDKWFRLRHIKSLINKCIENSRQAKLIGSSLECEVLIGSENQEFMEFLSGFDSENKVESLSKLFLVSSVKLGSADLEKALDIRVSENCTMKVLVQKAMGEKCQRCWVYSKSIGHNKQFNDLCNECAMEVIQSRKSD